MWSVFPISQTHLGPLLADLLAGLIDSLYTSVAGMLGKSVSPVLRALLLVSSIEIRHDHITRFLHKGTRQLRFLSTLRVPFLLTKLLPSSSEKNKKRIASV